MIRKRIVFPTLKKKKEDGDSVDDKMCVYIINFTYEEDVMGKKVN